MRRRYTTLITVVVLFWTTCPVLAEEPIWSRVPGPEGGSIDRLAVSRADPNILYAVSGARLFLSVDRGESWTLTGSPLSQPIGAVLPDPHQAERVFVWTQGQLFSRETFDSPWILLLSYVDNLQMVFDDHLHLFAWRYQEESSQFLHSFDLGETWHAVPMLGHSPETFPWIFEISVAPENAERFYARSLGEIYPPVVDPNDISLPLELLLRSDDGGNAWMTLIGTDNELGLRSVDQLWIDPNHSDHLAILGQRAASDDELLMATDRVLMTSRDAGATWQLSALPPDALTGGHELEFLNISPVSDALYAQAHVDQTSVLYHSTDGGVRWSEVYTDNTCGFSLLQVMATPDAALIRGCPNGVFVSNDEGASWVARNTGIDARRSGSFAIHRNDPSRIAAVFGPSPWIAYYTANAGQDWTTSNLTVAGYSYPHKIYQSPDNPEELFMPSLINLSATTRSEHRLYRSVDFGQSWHDYAIPQPASGNRIGGVTFDPQDSNQLYLTMSNGVVYRQTRREGSWQSLDFPDPSRISNATLSIFPNHPDRWIFGPWRSDDAGRHWTEMNLPELPSREMLNTYTFWHSIDIDPLSEQTLYASAKIVNRVLSFPFALYRSDNGGDSWIRLDENSQPLAAESIEFDPSNDDLFVYSGSDLLRFDGRDWLKLAQSAAPWQNDLRLEPVQRELYISSEQGLMHRAIDSIRDGQLVNVSASAAVSGQDRTLTAGFIIAEQQTLNLYAKGEGVVFDDRPAVNDPMIVLNEINGAQLAENDDLAESDLLRQTLENAGMAIGPRDAVLDISWLDAGAFALTLKDKVDRPAVGLVSLTTADAILHNHYRTEAARLVNVSSRAWVGGQNTERLRIGFIIHGVDAVEVLIKGEGPIMNIPSAVTNPALEVHSLDGELIAANQDWRTDPRAVEIADLIPPISDREAATLLTLEPGAYVLSVYPEDNETGEVLGSVTDLRFWRPRSAN